MSAPPLAVEDSAGGRPPVRVSAPHETAEQDPEASRKTDVERRALDVAERLRPTRFDVRARGTEDAQQARRGFTTVARSERNLLPACGPSSHEPDATAVLLRRAGRRCALPAPRGFGSPPRRAAATGKSSSSRFLHPPPRERGGPAGEDQVATGADDRDRRRLDRRFRLGIHHPRAAADALHEDARGARTTASRSAPRRPVSEVVRRALVGAHAPTRGTRTCTPPSGVVPPPSCSRQPATPRPSGRSLSSRGARLDRNQTTKPVPTR